MNVCILNTKELMQAQLAQAKLESHGIPSELRTNDASGLLPHLRFTQGIQLYVSKENLEQSIELLKDYFEKDSPQ
ncbi:MAG: DUF2007 domain-containing protein [Chlamydiota bacterium]|jgi:hypothetical protein